MALWQKVKRLNHAGLNDIATSYANTNLPIEVRDFCATWIEGSIHHTSPQAFVEGLKIQIHEKLQALQGSHSAPIYLMRRLADFQTSLTTIHTLDPGALQKCFLACMETERNIIRRNEEFVIIKPGMVPSASPGGASKGHSVPEIRMTPSPSNAFVQPHTPDPQLQYCEPETFLNNPVRIIIDSEMNKIFEAVWSLEDANNTFAFKCHELNRHRALSSQNTQNAMVNGNQHLQRYVESQELETQIHEIKGELLQMATLIWGKTNEVKSRTVTVLQNWTQLKSELDTDLLRWSQEQRHFANGKVMTMEVNELQHLSEYLMEVARKLRHYLQTTERVRQANPGLWASNSEPNPEHSIPAQLSETTALIVKLVQDTFVVVHQPCQVLKTNTRFPVPPGRSPMEVRLLVGEQMSLQLTPPSVTVSIIDESTCKDIEINGLAGEKFGKFLKKGRLLPDSARLELCQEVRCPTAVFRQISLKDFFRNGRKATIGKEQAECVTEEKFGLLFRSEFSLGDINFQLWRISLPIVITTHGSQDSLAWAAVTWDNAFAQPQRIPFHVVDHASWTSIAEMLNYRFISLVGAPLTQANLNYFAERLAFKPGFPDAISWTELCKVNLPERKFTFWDWFFEGAKLIEQHLKEAWKSGFVLGFISKEVSENMLCNSGCQAGTFLFRFSESILGAISIVWLHSDGKAYSLNPIKCKDLHPFVEKLNQETLHFVYPNTPKEEAFKKYYDDYRSAVKSEETSSVDRYVQIRNQLVIDNPNIPRFCLSAESPSGSRYDPLSQQNHSAKSSPHGRTEDNFIELDKIINFISSQEPTEASPASEFQYGTGIGDREGPRSTGSQQEYFNEESFYVQL